MNNEFRPELADAIELIQAREFESAIQVLTSFEESQDLELKVQTLNFIGTCYFHENSKKKAILLNMPKELIVLRPCSTSHKY